MSNNGKEYSAALLGSVAVNIFLVAFVLGSVSMPNMMPHPFASARHMPIGPHGQPPGFPFAGAGPFEGAMPPPPPMFSPAEIFGPGDMQQGLSDMKKNFEKMQELRLEFSQMLEKGSVTKAEALKHFAQMDEVMDSVKSGMQAKAAEKISSMPEEERKRFAKHLEQKTSGPGFMGGPHP